MSRNLKRVPLDFSWPLNRVWGGFVNPYYELATDCPDCDHGYDRLGGRPDANAALFYGQWYGHVPFDAAAYGAVPIAPDSPVIWAMAQRNIKAAPDFFKSPDETRASTKFKADAMAGFPNDDRPLIPFLTFDQKVAVKREARRLYEMCFRGHWNHHLIQLDVDALVAGGRLHDLTHTWTRADGWQPRADKHHPSAAEVNAWSYDGFGHDATNAGICVKARCAREGVPYECTRCAGTGRIWPSPKIEQQYEAWTREGPPTGDGYQLWEDCSEGSPVSPVFTTLAELCTWAAENATTFADFKATAAEWQEMLEGGVVHATKGNAIFI